MSITAWITGAHGFIGRHLALYLKANAHRVFGIGHGSWPLEDAQAWGMHGWVSGEIESAILSSLRRESGHPAFIYHLAGGSSVGLSLLHPLEDFRRTVETSARLLEWVRTHAPDTIVVCVSSAAVYGAAHAGPIPETARLMPYSPYGFHKSMMEAQCLSYQQNYNLRIAIVRLFSVYGAGLEKQLLWDLCGKFQRSPDKVMLGGTGEELRDWIHISDVVCLLHMLATSPIESTSTLCVNGGTGQGVTVAEIAAHLRDIWGSNAAITFSGISRPGDPTILLSNNAAATKLGFAANMPLRQGLQEYVTWYKSRAVSS